MTPVKRIEIILSEPLVPHLVDVLEAHQYQAYCISHGHSGRSTGKIMMGGMSDTIVTLICAQDEADILLPHIENFLERYGGISTVVDAIGMNVRA